MSKSNKDEDKNKDIQDLIFLIKELYNKSNDLYDDELKPKIFSKINGLTNTNIIKTLKIIKIYLLYSHDLLDYRINCTRKIEEIEIPEENLPFVPVNSSIIFG